MKTYKNSTREKTLYCYHYRDKESVSAITRSEAVVATTRYAADDLILRELVFARGARVEVNPTTVCAVDVEVEPIDTFTDDSKREACWSSERINRYAAGLGSGKVYEEHPYPGRGIRGLKEIICNAFCSNTKLMSMIRYILLHGSFRPHQIASKLLRMGVLIPSIRMKLIGHRLDAFVCNPEELTTTETMDKKRIYRI